MTLDIGIDFDCNDGPPRGLVLTDWEYRLVLHCIGLYHEAAVTLDDATRPLAASVLRKLDNARVAELSSVKRQRARQRELDDLRRQLEGLGSCEHPDESVTAAVRGGGEVAVSRSGLMHGLCTCGRRVVREVDAASWRPLLHGVGR